MMKMIMITFQKNKLSLTFKKIIVEAYEIYHSSLYEIIKDIDNKWKLATTYIKDNDNKWKPAIMYIKTNNGNEHF